MTPVEFAAAIIEIGQKYDGSVRSWGRTVAHSIAVGGFASDPHTWWLGCDMTYDSPPVEHNLQADCARLGLRVLHEKSHDHYQPLGWVNKEHHA
jgi:hypothetical protein